MPSMLKILLKNGTGRYATRLYPAETREPFDKNRADLVFDPDCCRLCKTCARKCPTGAIDVDKENRTWKRDVFSCVFCGDCIEACPKSCLSFVVRPPLPQKHHQQAVVCATVPERSNP